MSIRIFRKADYESFEEWFAEKYNDTEYVRVFAEKSDYEKNKHMYVDAFENGKIVGEDAGIVFKSYKRLMAKREPIIFAVCKKDTIKKRLKKRR